MKKYLSIFTLITLSILLISCKDVDDKFKLDIELKEKVIDGKLNVEVLSNLPDSTIASISLANDDIEYYGVSELIFNNGIANTPESFSSQQKPLKKGTYTLSFVVPLANVQPESVREITGENFSKVDSEYLFHYEFGTIIQYDKKVTIN